MAIKFNPNNPKDLSLLQERIRASQTKQESFVNNYDTLMQEYAGDMYGDGPSEAVPIPLLYMFVNIITREVVARHPRMSVRALTPALEPVAETFELVLNQALRNMGFADIQRQMFQEGLFGGGFSKQGITFLDDPGGNGTQGAIAQPFVQVIRRDQIILDMSASAWGDQDYIGNVFHVPVEEARTSQLYIKSVAKELTATTRAESLTTSDRPDDEYRDRLIDHVELQEVWIPHLNVVVTFPSRGESKPLRVVEWTGPVGGPFRNMAFYPLSGRLLGIAPAGPLFALHRLANVLFNKMESEARSHKKFGTTRASGSDEINRVLNVADGSVITMDGEIQEHTLGGISQETILAFNLTRQLFTWAAGNLDLMGGLSAQSETATQDNLLAGNASKVLFDFQDRHTTWVKNVATDVAHWLWKDEWTQTKVIKEFTKAGRGVPVTFRPDHREGSFEDFQFDIEPYSTRHQTPESRLAAIMQVFERIIVPLMPMLAQRGDDVRVDELLKIIRDNADMPEIDRLIDFRTGPPTGLNGSTPGGAGEGAAGQAGKPPVTRRIYERVNTPGANRAGQDSVLNQIMAGGKPQAAEMASLFK